jgi:hypothetical protein
MGIPDQSHINHIRDALWKTPTKGASVMVGAGFSRFADKIGVHSREFPLWCNIACSLYSKLYSHNNECPEYLPPEITGTSNFLRLAQEFETAFGRGALNKLIQEMIPDNYYFPGIMHTRLMNLPWRDVFTTNWDTLLERTRPLEHAYDTVHSFDEIPFALTSRIIKLHGTLPAYFPFIITEEDYRTYPKKFAPFVNTAQQAMMETTFLLLGFSGDDPNFLHWSGWVRDNLGALAPKIYLAGWLNLSPHRRRMLENNNVVPIDVAEHPSASTWPENLLHYYAANWILHTLEQGRPYNACKWPFPENSTLTSIPKELLPVEEVVFDQPKNEFAPKQTNSDLAKAEEQVLTAVNTWVHNRRLYPGWLVLPPKKHELFQHMGRRWEQEILKVIPNLDPVEALKVLREYVWRLEIKLLPLSDKLEDAIQNNLKSIDCQKRTIAGEDNHSVDWVVVRECWRMLALSLLTSARQQFDTEPFEARIESLKPFLKDDPNINQYINYEKCLKALYEFDYKSLDDMLKNWNPEGCDPIWMLRKAAILVEMNRNEEARQLTNASLSAVRESLHQKKHNYEAMTREGWILYLAYELECNTSRLNNIVSEQPSDRWGKLAPFLCDAPAQVQDFIGLLKEPPRSNKGPLFDLGHKRGETVHFSDYDYQQLLASYRLVRLCEIAGLPPKVDLVIIGSKLLAAAAEELIPSNYSLSLSIAVRVTTSEDDSTINNVLSRKNIALVPAEEANKLVERVRDAIKYILSTLRTSNNSSVYWITRLRIMLEVLSRLSLRLPPDCAVEIFKQTLAYYKIDIIAKHAWLYKVMDNLLRRTWESIPNQYRKDLVFDILSAPIVGHDNFEATDYYPDPGDLIKNDSKIQVPDRSTTTEEHWSDIISMVTRCLKIVGQARKRAITRLLPLNSWQVLNEEEKTLVKEALWHPDYVPADELPSRGTKLLDWVFILLPEATPGMALKLFKKKWFSKQNIKSYEEFHKLFMQVSCALAGLEHNKYHIELTEEELINLSAAVERWIELPIPTNDNDPLGFDQHYTAETIKYLQNILFNLSIPDPTAISLFEKAVDLNKVNIPSYPLFPCLIKLMPEKREEIVMHLRMGLAADNTDLSKSAISGLHSWIESALDKQYNIPEPDEDLIKEVGVIIATRRKGVPIQALNLALTIFTKGTDDQRKVIEQLVIDGMNYLLAELSYNHSRYATTDEDIPLLRWGCIHIALAMKELGYNKHSITQWIEEAKRDPLPEVRYAETPILTHTRQEPLTWE